MALMAFPRSRRYVLVLPVNRFGFITGSSIPHLHEVVQAMSSDSTMSMSIVGAPATESPPMVGRYAVRVVVDQLSGICGLNLWLFIAFR